MNNTLTTTQAARRLNLHPETVRKLLRRGTLRGMKYGGYSKFKHWRVKKQDLVNFIEAGAGSAHTEASKE